MNVITVLKVFRGSSLITPQGEFKISRVFPDGRAAAKAGYSYYRSDNGIAIYSRPAGKGKRRFAVAGK
jgi:hypothetical protein